MKKLLSTSLVVLVLFSFITITLSAEGAKEKKQVPSGREGVTYWAFAGDMYNVENDILKKWNKENPDKVIVYNPIPAGASSEMILQTAISSNTAPTMTGQLEAFFANYLSEKADAMVPLDTLPGFNELIKSRKAESFLDKIRANDGHIYMIPVHWQPALCAYNKALLDRAGVSKPPRTYSEFNDFAEKLIAAGGNNIAIDFDPTAAWWKVGYYLHTFYRAAKGDLQEIGKNGIDFDSKVSRAFLGFVFNAFSKGYASKDKQAYNFLKEMNVGFCTLVSSGYVKKIRSMRPNMQIIVVPPLVPDFINPNFESNVDASIKGIGILKNSGNIETAWKFMKWRFTNIDFDIEQVEKTGMLTMRGDWLTNSKAKSYLDKHPDLKVFAKYVPYSNGIISNKKVDIYTAVKNDLWEPVIFGKKDMETGIKDAKEAVEKIMSKN